MSDQSGVEDRGDPRDFDNRNPRRQENRSDEDDNERESAFCDAFELLTPTSIPILILDRDLCILGMTPQAAALLGLDVDARGVWIGGREDAFARSIAEGAKEVFANGGMMEFELRGDDSRWHLVRVAARESEPEPAASVAVTLIDITERKRSEERMRRVMRESAHRIKNTLAVIESVAEQTAKHANDLDSFRESFGKRLRSMSATHALLTQAHWEGARLRALVEAELAAHGADGERTRIEGPDVMLWPKAAMALQMTLHELATNACKYGAMSSPGGLIELRWEFERGNPERLLRLRWIEHCEHAVGEPEREGYGTRLIRQLAAYELGGEVALDFAESGLRCEITFPMEDPEEVRPEEEEEEEVVFRRGRRVLVVEDMYTLAEMLREALVEEGCSVIGPAASMRRAEALLARERPDAAILDVRLDGELVYPLARWLRGAGVPFVLLTGCAREDLPEDLRDAAMLHKPVSREEISGAVRSLLGAA
ncbi:MAG: HWE histidine kinase domain-containing protein [Planctomycetota bacterium]|nr:HWE histidine kinase domain-containing protein [Planctomycetota bacterium]